MCEGVPMHVCEVARTIGPGGRPRLLLHMVAQPAFDAARTEDAAVNLLYVAGEGEEARAERAARVHAQHNTVCSCLTASICCLCSLHCLPPSRSCLCSQLSKSSHRLHRKEV